MQRVFILAVAAAMLLPGGASAQSPSEPPRELMVAPNAPQSLTETPAHGQSPVNICDELVAYLQEQQKGAPPGASPGASSGGGPSGGGAAPAAQGAEPAAQGAAPGQTTPPVDRPQHSSGITAPVPNAASNSAQPIPLDQAQALAASGDRPGCQRAVRQMRRAGAALPPALLALAALREDLLGR